MIIILMTDGPASGAPRAPSCPPQPLEPTLPRVFLSGV